MSNSNRGTKGGKGSVGTLDRKVAHITGAGSGGTGTAMAIRFAAEGAKVALVARNEAGLENTAERIREVGGEALVLPCDLGDPDGGRDTLIARNRGGAGADRRPRQQRGQARPQALLGVLALGPAVEWRGEPLGALAYDPAGDGQHGRAWRRIRPQHVEYGRGAPAGTAVHRQDEVAQHALCRHEVRREHHDRLRSGRIPRTRASS